MPRIQRSYDKNRAPKLLEQPTVVYFHVTGNPFALWRFSQAQWLKFKLRHKIATFFCCIQFSVWIRWMKNRWHMWRIYFWRKVGAIHDFVCRQICTRNIAYLTSIGCTTFGKLLRECFENKFFKKQISNLKGDPTASSRMLKKSRSMKWVYRTITYGSIAIKLYSIWLSMCCTFAKLYRFISILWMQILSWGFLFDTYRQTDVGSIVRHEVWIVSTWYAGVLNANWKL